MSPQSEGRPSTDRRVGDGAYGTRGVPRQQHYESVNQQIGANGYIASDLPQQRFVGPTAGDDQNTNGILPLSPVDGREGRDRQWDNTFTLPLREREQINGHSSQTTGHSGSQLSTGTMRVCQKCGELLTGQFVRALDGTFHLQCFKCRVSALVPLNSSVRTNTGIAGLFRNCSFEILPRGQRRRQWAIPSL